MWKIIIFLTVCGCAVGQNESVTQQTNFCKATVNCYETAEQQWSICEYVQSTIGGNNKTSKKQPDTASCKIEINKMRKEKNNLERLRVKQFRSCLSNLTDGNESKLTVDKKHKCSKRNATVELIDFGKFDVPSNVTASQHKQIQKLKKEKSKFCVNHHKKMEKQCTSLRNCCHLSKICDEVYETNQVFDTHLKIHQHSLKILLAETECHSEQKRG